MVRVRNMELGIQGRTAAVAAGTAGLGLGTAKALAAEGVRIMREELKFGIIWCAGCP